MSELMEYTEIVVKIRVKGPAASWEGDEGNALLERCWALEEDVQGGAEAIAVRLREEHPDLQVTVTVNE